MKKLVAAAPRVAELKDYEDRPIQSNEVRVKVESVLQWWQRAGTRRG